MGFTHMQRVPRWDPHLMIITFPSSLGLRCGDRIALLGFRHHILTRALSGEQDGTKLNAVSGHGNF